MTIPTRHGYYVNDKRYSLEQRAQAIARAEYIATEYGRDIPVLQVEHNGAARIAHTARPNLENSVRSLLLSVM